MKQNLKIYKNKCRNGVNIKKKRVCTRQKRTVLFYGFPSFSGLFKTETVPPTGHYSHCK